MGEKAEPIQTEVTVASFILAVAVNLVRVPFDGAWFSPLLHNIKGGLSPPFNIERLQNEWEIDGCSRRELFAGEKSSLHRGKGFSSSLPCMNI